MNMELGFNPMKSMFREQFGECVGKHIFGGDEHYLMLFCCYVLYHEVVVYFMCFFMYYHIDNIYM